MNESMKSPAVRSKAQSESALYLDALEAEYKELDNVDAAVVLALIRRLREAEELERLLRLIESGFDARGYELSIEGMKSLARYALKGKST